MSNFIYYEKLEDYEEQVRKAKECDEKDKEIERLNKENEELKKIQCTFLGTGCKAEVEKLNNIINEINSIVEYWGYDKEQNDISSFRMAMKTIKDALGSDKE